MSHHTASFWIIPCTWGPRSPNGSQHLIGRTSKCVSRPRPCPLALPLRRTCAVAAGGSHSGPRGGVPGRGAGGRGAARTGPRGGCRRARWRGCRRQAPGGRWARGEPVLQQEGVQVHIFHVAERQTAFPQQRRKKTGASHRSRASSRGPTATNRPGRGIGWTRRFQARSRDGGRRKSRLALLFLQETCGPARNGMGWTHRRDPKSEIGFKSPAWRRVREVRRWGQRHRRKGTRIQKEIRIKMEVGESQLEKRKRTQQEREGERNRKIGTQGKDKVYRGIRLETREEGSRKATQRKRKLGKSGLGTRWVKGWVGERKSASSVILPAQVPSALPHSLFGAGRGSITQAHSSSLFSM